MEDVAIKALGVDPGVYERLYHLLIPQALCDVIKYNRQTWRRFPRSSRLKRILR